MLKFYHLQYLIFQSTLPRRERHINSSYPYVMFKISIHAPAKGATGTYFNVNLSFIISIHAPAKGATY